MDLTQRKLSRTEWNNIEIPLPPGEKNILQLIIDGYHDIRLKRNNSLSLLGLMKIDPNISGIHYYLYNQNFDSIIKKHTKKYKSLCGDFNVNVEAKEKKIPKIKSNKKPKNIVFSISFQ